MNSPPVVTFRIVDQTGNVVTGLAPSNVAVGMAKLIPADTTTKAPSRWVNYLPFANTPSDTVTAIPNYPSTDKGGKLVDNGDGTYTYTFGIDITKAQAYADAASYSGSTVRADVGDLTYVPTLTHRAFVLAGGKMPGTTTQARSSANLTYDWIPATGQPVGAADAQRVIVAQASCNECHSKLAMHDGFFPAVTDTNLCAACHTDQQKIGFGESLPASGTTLTTSPYHGMNVTMKLMGRATADFPNMVHKIHYGHKLFYQGYNQFGVAYNHVTYPQPAANCVKCHDGSATAINKTPQGENWKNVPSRLACGACHDGINFATGGGTTIKGGTEGHVGRAQPDDSQCVLCHSAATTPIDHVTVDPTGANGRGGYPLNTAVDTPTPGFPSGQGPSIPLASQLNLPAGVYKMNYELKSATIASGQATVIYRVLKDGKPVTFNATGFLMDGVDGSPNIQIYWAAPADGITTPVDWNDSARAYTFKELRDKAVGSSQTGPDADGYYTATFPLSKAIPAGATQVVAVMSTNYNGFVQLNHPDYPNGIRLREPKFLMLAVPGYETRRAVVSADKCNACHGQLGVGPSFHSGARNNGEGCSLCHQPATATGHTGPENHWGGGWSVSAKNMVHAIHASAMRSKAFTYEATAENPDGFAEVTYPGVLNNCEQCHVAGSYDFSGAKNAAALPNLLWTTEAKNANMANPDPIANPSIGLSPWIDILGRGQVDYSTDNLVSSPIASTCFGCHDSNSALAHMQQNGGKLYEDVSKVSVSGTGDRSKGFVNSEACMVCHAPGKIAPIKDVHRVGR